MTLSKNRVWLLTEEASLSVDVTASTGFEYARRAISRTWAGFDEIDVANRNGAAELADDVVLEFKTSRRRGDQAALKVRGR